ncbi:hypothetical protein [Kribbella sp. CA-247076]|uniref:hypothetical protein n=1 Tax=Kribbella sp. CA-247076 TaxID=3239941 RepID=UPI003D8AF89A
MKPISAATAAGSRPPWQNRRRLRQAAYTVGALLSLYGVLVVIALLGGPRIGASFLPLPGGGPDPASPVAGLEPSTRLPTGGPTVPRGSETPVPTAPPTPGQTPSLPPATTTAPGTGQVTENGQPATPCPTTKPAIPQLVDHQEPTHPPATKVPPKPTTRPPADPTTQPPDPPTKPPTKPPTEPPPTSDPPPPPPDDPDEPNDPGLVGGLLTTILDTLGL